MTRAVLATDTGLVKVIDVVEETQQQHDSAKNRSRRGSSNGEEDEEEKVAKEKAVEEKVVLTAQWGTQARSEEIHSMRARGSSYKNQVSKTNPFPPKLN